MVVKVDIAEAYDYMSSEFLEFCCGQDATTLPKRSSFSTFHSGDRSVDHKISGAWFGGWLKSFSKRNAGVISRLHFAEDTMFCIGASIF